MRQIKLVGEPVTNQIVGTTDVTGQIHGFQALHVTFRRSKMSSFIVPVIVSVLGPRRGFTGCNKHGRASSLGCALILLDRGGQSFHSPATVQLKHETGAGGHSRLCIHDY